MFASKTKRPIWKNKKKSRRNFQQSMLEEQDAWSSFLKYSTTKHRKSIAINLVKGLKDLKTCSATKVNQRSNTPIITSNRIQCPHYKRNQKDYLILRTFQVLLIRLLYKMKILNKEIIPIQRTNIKIYL